MDTADIQGNILAGFNTDFEMFLSFELPDNEDPRGALQWIGNLAPIVSSVEDVRQSRLAMRIPDAQQAPWLAIAISYKLVRIAAPNTFFDDNFSLGMVAKKSAIGDETLPTDWEVGGPGNEVDLLLIVASNDEAKVKEMAARLINEAVAGGFTLSFSEMGKRLPGEIEHFGFKDGISQPAVAGDRGPSGLQPGHFVFGYSRAEGGLPATNPGDDQDFSKNGSYLVFRRLSQDVASFNAFFEEESRRLAPEWPGLNAEHLAALVVGRWPSGAPASIAVTSDPGSGPNDDDFDFSGDRSATSCPFAAHIRKVNPRNGNADVVTVPRIIRRGIPFGPVFRDDPDADRGLLFVSYQTSIKSQFVFLSGSWMNQENAPQNQGGFDLLVGRSASTRRLPINGPFGTVTVSFDRNHWVIPTGGAYLFAPGKSSISQFSTPPMLA